MAAGVVMTPPEPAPEPLPGVGVGVGVTGLGVEAAEDKPEEVAVLVGPEVGPDVVLAGADELDTPEEPEEPDEPDELEELLEELEVLEVMGAEDVVEEGVPQAEAGGCVAAALTEFTTLLKYPWSMVVGLTQPRSVGRCSFCHQKEIQSRRACGSLRSWVGSFMVVR